MVSLLEEIAPYWYDQEQSCALFKKAHRFNFIFEAKRLFGSAGALGRNINRSFVKISNTCKGDLKVPCFAHDGLLLQQHRTISVELSGGSDAFSDQQRSVSGSGDGFSERDAQSLALLELAERASFKLGKYWYRLNNGCLLDGRSLGRVMTEPFVPSSTSGFALEATPERAILKAILEVLERDAFLCHWYTQISPRPIALPEHPIYRIITKRAQALNLDFHAYRLHSISKEVFVIYLVINDSLCKKGVTYFCSGLASSFSLYDAFMKAYFELDRFVGLTHQLVVTGKMGVPDIATPLGRFYHYLQPENQKALCVFSNSSIAEESLSEAAQKKIQIRNSLPKLLKQLPSKPIIYPGPALRSLKNDIFTCFAHIPGMMQLDYEHPSRLLIQRLRSFAGGASFTVNPNPHPLP